MESWSNFRPSLESAEAGEGPSLEVTGAGKRPLAAAAGGRPWLEATGARAVAARAAFWDLPLSYLADFCRPPWLGLPNLSGASLMEVLEALVQRLIGPLSPELLFEVLQQRLFPPDVVPISEDWMSDKALLDEMEASDQQEIENAP